MGLPYSPEHIKSTVEAMTVDALAYSLKKLDGKDKNIAPYRAKAQNLIRSGASGSDAALCALTGLTQTQLDSARAIYASIEGSKDMLSRMMVMGSMMSSKPGTVSKIADRKETPEGHKMMLGMSPEKAIAMAKKMGASDEAISKMEAAMKRKSVVPGASGSSHGGPGHKKELTAGQIDFALAVHEVERALGNVDAFRAALAGSPEAELASVVNALAGGYTSPTSGGDPVLNPDILPTGRNMFAVNAEETPSAVAWEKGKALADNTIAMYRKNHGDSIPRKVSYTLWSSEFIETEGATIAQALYMLGVEPVRDPFRQGYRPEAYSKRGAGPTAYRCGGADFGSAPRPRCFAAVPYKPRGEDGR